MASSRKSTGRFGERAEMLDFLLEVTRITSESLDLDQLMRDVAGIVKTVVSFDLFAILLYSEKSQGLRIRYSIGHREEVVRNLVIPLGEGIVGDAAQSREPQLVEDVRRDPRYLSVLDAVRTELAVPMIARRKLVGVIDLQSTNPHAYNAQDKALMRLIASRVASSIENAVLYRRVDQRNRTVRTLAALSQEFSSILDLDELLSKIAASVRTLINYDAFSIFLVDSEKRVLRHRFSVRYDQRVHVDNILLDEGITGAAARTREPVRVMNTLNDPRYISSHPNIHSELAVPLMVQDRVIGVLDVESERAGAFSEDHQQTLSLLAPQIASSVENARLYEELVQREQRMEQDLKAARNLQKILLPRNVEIHGLEIGIRSRPARDITGDVYEFYEHGGDYAVIVFGDVSGKGPAAALYGALISGLLRTLAPRRRSPALLMQSINDALLERRVDAQYATLTVLLWDPRARLLTFCNAGAEVPLIWRNGEVLTLRASGVPVGLLDDRQYEEVEFQTERGDAVLLCSDGVHDQLNDAEKHFSRSRTQDLFRKRGGERPQKIADAIIKELDKFRADTPITDDQTVVVMRVT